MSSEVQMLARDGLLGEYIEEMADIIYACEEEYDIDEFYNRMSEDLVTKGAYLSEDDDIELIIFLMNKAQAIIDEKISKNSQRVVKTFSTLGVEIDQ